MTETQPDNPLLEPWTGPFEAPPFDRIAPRHFEPGLRGGAEGERGPRSTPSPPIPRRRRFANTIEAMERSGRALDRVAKVFFNLAGAETNDELEAIERAIAPVLSRARERHLSQRRAVPPHRRPEGERDGARPHARAGARARPHASRLHPRRRRVGAGSEGPARRDRRTARRAVGRLRPERAGGRTGLAARARRGRPRRASGLLGRERGAARRRARPSRPLRRDAGALQRRAVPAIFGAPGSARKPRFAPGARAARTAARPTTARSPEKWCA